MWSANIAARCICMLSTRRRIWRILIASALMGVALYLTNVAIQPLLGVPWWRGLALLVLLSVAALSYFGVGQLIGAFKLSEFKGALRRC